MGNTLQAQAQIDLLYYQGQLVEEDFKDIFLRTLHHFAPSYVDVVGASYHLNIAIRQLHFETEAQLAKHHGMQDHWEGNLLLLARVRLGSSPLSLAYGNGLSYATERPTVEDETPGQRLLNYIVVETDLELPQALRQLHLIFRTHHRSGVFGAYGCKNLCGSNFLATGLKVSF